MKVRRALIGFPSFVPRFGYYVPLFPRVTHLHHESRCCTAAAAGRREHEAAWRARSAVGFSAADGACRRRRSARATSGPALVEAPHAAAAAAAAARLRTIGSYELARRAEIDHERFSGVRRRHCRYFWLQHFYYEFRARLTLDFERTSSHSRNSVSFTAASFSSKWFDSTYVLARLARSKRCCPRQRETAGSGQSSARCSHHRRHRQRSSALRSLLQPPRPLLLLLLLLLLPPLLLLSSASSPLATPSSLTPRRWPCRIRSPRPAKSAP